MESATFNRLKQTATCFMCKKNSVPLAFWNKPCEECKKKLKAAASQVSSQEIQDVKVIPFKLGKRMPAARIEKEKTRITPREDIYVDKYGRKVENPGYDPVNDPRGWKATGTAAKAGLMVF